MNPELDSDRLRYKPISIENAQIMYELSADPKVMKHIREVDSDIEHTKGYIVDTLNYTKENPGFGMWNCFLKGSNEYIGWCVTHHIERNNKLPIEIGYRFHQKYWGQGYATEAAKKMVQYAKEELNLEQICGITIDENKGSRRVLEKAGLSYKERRNYYNYDVMYFELNLKEQK